MSQENVCEVMETIDDIVKEMRGNAEHNHALVEVAKYLNEIADRIEAAHKRESESGAEKMRENLGEVMHKKYTAQKIREIEAIVASGDIGPMTRENVALMLKQAAEMLDRLDEDIGCESTCEESSQVRNVAKMREALLEASIALSSATHHHLTEDDAKDCLAVIESALSFPSRNCDVLSDKQEALAAIHEDRCYVNNPIDERRLTVEWLFDEAKGETHEQK